MRSGRRFRWGRQVQPWTEVVGVVGDTIEHSLRNEHRPRFYLSYFRPGESPDSLKLAVRAAGDAGEFARRLRAVGTQVDPQLIQHVWVLDDLIRRTLAEERALALLATLFGSVALLLAMLGLYGVVAFSVTRRTNEIGVRMALGARPGRVLAMVMRETMWLAAAGALAGVPLAMLGARLIASLLFGLSAADPVTLAGAVGVILAVAAIAGVLPAARAARVDPLRALRAE